MNRINTSLSGKSLNGPTSPAYSPREYLPPPVLGGERADPNAGYEQDLLVLPSPAGTSDGMSTNRDGTPTRPDQPAPPRASSPRRSEPFKASTVNYRRLAGADFMIDNATGGCFKTAKALFERLEAAEEAERDHHEQIRAGMRAPADSATDQIGGAPPNRTDLRCLAEETTSKPTTGAQAASWVRVKRTIGSMFEKTCLYTDKTSNINADAFLRQEMDTWSQEGFDGAPDVNPSYRFDVDVLATVLTSLRVGRNLMLTGPTGCGKTTLAEQVAARLNLPYVRIPVDGELRRREMIGGWLQAAGPAGSYTAWQDGILTKAYGMPSIVMLDEIDHADSDMLYACHEALERKTMQIIEQPERRIRMHPGCAIFGSANTRGTGDVSGQYAVKEPMSEATRNRFTYFIPCTYLPEAQEQIIVNRTFPNLPAGASKKICAAASDLRKSLLEGHIRTACSTRQVLDVACDILERASFDTSPVDARIKGSIGRVMVSRAADEADEAVMAALVNARFR